MTMLMQGAQIRICQDIVFSILMAKQGMARHAPLTPGEEARLRCYITNKKGWCRARCALQTDGLSSHHVCV